jgi:GWxTD domain-containing protein
LHIVDQESKKTAKLEYPLKVRDFSKDSLALSDLMLVHRMSMEGTRKNIVPNLTNSVEQGLGEFYMFFEIYNRVQLDSVQLICKFTNTQKEIVLQRSKYEVLSGNRTQVIWKIDTPALAADRYLISIEAMGSTKNLPGVQLTGSTLRTCLIKMKDLPVTITNIDKATDQLRYIALESDMDYIREAKTPEEKLKRFFDFWAKRDPDPKTPHNELMEEYYSRVDYANKNFIGYIEGWKTDMGMIYIHFGPPQNVERHPFDSDSKPYEIWYYYEQNREFIFVDETGFGDYRLRYPTTDLWGRIR